MKYDAIIFDFDGTVADTGRGVKNAIKYALGQFSIPVGDESRLDYFIGPPLYEGFTHVYGVDDEMSNALVDAYRVYYGKQGVFECDPYPGMLELLGELKEAGVKLSVASSKPKHFLDMVIPFIGADKYFDCIVGPELKNHDSNKTKLVLSACKAMGVEPSKKVAMIGDRFYDIEGANAAGVTSVGVEYGYGSREEFLKYNADSIVCDMNELRNILI